MKIAITAQGRSLDSAFEQRFGQAPFFLIGDSDSDAFFAIENAGRFQSGGAGVAAGQLLADQKVEALITGNVGPNAARVLQAAQIAVHRATTRSVREALEAFRQGQLQSVSGATVGLRAGVAGGPAGEVTSGASARDAVVAVATDGHQVAAHFGHCPEFTFATIKNGAVISRRTLPNPGHRPDFLPGYLAERGVTAIVAGGMGSRAVELFGTKGIETIVGVSGTVADAIEAFRHGHLRSGESMCDH